MTRFLFDFDLTAAQALPSLSFSHEARDFGHALETATGYGTLLHGEAVAIGMLLAARLSSSLGLAPIEDAQRLATLLATFGLPTTPPPGDPQRLVELMRLDK